MMIFPSIVENSLGYQYEVQRVKIKGPFISVATTLLMYTTMDFGKCYFIHGVLTDF